MVSSSISSISSISSSINNSNSNNSNNSNNNNNNNNNNMSSEMFADGQFDDPCNPEEEQFEDHRTDYDQTFLLPSTTNATNTSNSTTTTTTAAAPPLLQPTQVQRNHLKKRARSTPSIRNEQPDPDLMAFQNRFKIKQCNNIVKVLRGKRLPATDDNDDDDDSMEGIMNGEICLSYHCKGRCASDCRKRAFHRTLSPSEKEHVRQLLKDVVGEIEANAIATAELETLDIGMADNGGNGMEEGSAAKRLKATTIPKTNGTKEEVVDLTSSEASSTSIVSSRGESFEASSSLPPPPEEGEENVEDPQLSAKSLAGKRLELVKAKLELAKQKLAIQSKQQQQQQQVEAPKTANNHVQLALQQARAKLQGALENRDRALQQQQQPKFLPPISALSASLIIQNISQTGPEEMVYFATTTTNQRGGDYLRRSRKEYTDLIPHQELEDKVSLSARKMQLERDLTLLGERLESSYSSMAVTTTTITMTREELQRKLEEAQAHKDISYWRHFVSKQEHLLASVQNQIRENTNSLHKCADDKENDLEQSHQARENIATLELRQAALANLISQSTMKLLEMRKSLHQEEEKASRRTTSE